MLLGKSNGFFLIELLLALMIWMLIAGTFIPIYIKVSKQSIGIQKEKEAIQILHEELLDYKRNGGEVKERIETRNYNDYRITWTMNAENPVPEVCVDFEQADKEVIKKCKYAE